MDLRVVPYGRRSGRELAEAAHHFLVRCQRKLATVMVFVIACLLAVHVIFGSNGWAAYQKKRVENKQLQQELQQIQRENEALEQRVKALNSDPSAIEKEAREQLRYAKPGEVVYVVPEQRPAQPSAAGIAQKQSKP